MARSNCKSNWRFTKIEISKKEKIQIKKIKINSKIQKIINQKLLLVYTNQQRFARSFELSKKEYACYNQML